MRTGAVELCACPGCPRCAASGVDGVRCGALVPASGNPICRWCRGLSALAYDVDCGTCGAPAGELCIARVPAAELADCELAHQPTALEALAGAADDRRYWPHTARALAGAELAGAPR